MRPKLCYVLPMYRRDADEHFVHTVDFLRRLSQQVQLTVLVERGEAPVIPGAEVHLLPQVNRAGRIAGLLYHAVRLRWRGYRTFFVRISVPAALSLCLLRPLGILTYYWNSGMAKEVKPAWSCSWPVIKEKLTRELPFWLTLRMVHRLVTGPERMVQYYAGAYGVSPDRIVVCYNDINPDRFTVASPSQKALAHRALGLPAGRKIILSVHRHSPIRRPLFYYPEIIRAVGEKDPNVLFVLVGGGPQEAELRARLKALGLDPFVRWVGPVPNLWLPQYYHAADLFIMPSWVEGFPRVLLEAMATGVPFVTTDAGGVEDILTPLQRQYMIPREDRRRFSEAVLTLLGDEKTRQALAADGLARVQRFTTARVVEMYLDRVVCPGRSCGDGGSEVSSNRTA